MYNADLVILGGGPAGYRAAEQAGHRGMDTVLAEERALGGVCLNEGCIPSKTLLHSAKVLDTIQTAATYGVSCPAGAAMDHPKVLARKDRVVKMLVSGVAKSVEQAGVRVVPGRAVLDGKEGELFRVRIGDEIYRAPRILLATGSAPSMPPIPGLGEGLAQGRVITSREALSMREVPGELVVIGGGVVGLELACYYKAAGSKVTVVELLPRIAAGMDEDVCAMLLAQLKKKGIRFVLGGRVTEVTESGVTAQQGEETLELAADKILLAGGRSPVTDGLGLESIGLFPGKKGGVETDARLRTCVTGVWAAGDINGRSMLAHTAYREAEVAVGDMLGDGEEMSYLSIPAVIYTSPEAAGVGLTEQAARDLGLTVKTAQLSLRYSGRFLAEVQGGDGICKVVVDATHDKLVGAHMLGSYASELISGAATLISTGTPVGEIKKVAFAHPTVAEIWREALCAAK